MEKVYDLERFIKAQDAYNTYAQALREIKAGRKQSHWIWYIFPQLKGLGFTQRATYYGIEDIDEARSYLSHPVLGKRLLEITEALMNLQETDPTIVMGGYPDDIKLCSCMTLFAKISEEGSIFHRVLDKFFGGQMDNNTLALL